MKYNSSERGKPSNSPIDGDVFSMMLKELSVVELTDALSYALETATEDNCDFELIEAYLDALNRKNPLPEIPDTKASYTDFQQQVYQMVPTRAGKARIVQHRFHRGLRVGLVAAMVVACVLGSMAVAQAAGVDVFGAVAGWTSEVFSLGTIRSPGAVDIPYDTGESQPHVENSAQTNGSYLTLQEALDINGVTEFSEPAWFPDGYELDNIDVVCKDDGTLRQISAIYISSSDFITIDILPYTDEPLMQIQKTDAVVKSFELRDFTVYLLENNRNNTAAWATNHYECYVGADLEATILEQIVTSSYVEIS